MRVRLGEAHDNEAIRAIHNHYVATSLAIFDLVARSAAEQSDWMAAHAGAHPVVVAEHDAEVVGFGSLSPYRSRPAYAMTVEDSVYVAEDARGNGAGRAILAELLRLATSYGYHSVIARIAGSNEASVRLHAALGFDLVGVEREVGRKFGTWLDVVEMQRLL